MIENFNPFISLGGDNQKVNHMAEAALEMNLTCNDLKKDLIRVKFLRPSRILILFNLLLISRSSAK